MLVPQLVREKLPTAIIGVFHARCFSSSEMFRYLSVREHLLRGMLSADLIGSQTANYVRHFHQTVSHILVLISCLPYTDIPGDICDVTVNHS